MSEIVWTGPRDDKTAIWSGLQLRAERVEVGEWVWAVLSDSGWSCFASSKKTVKNGKLAREAAEAAARKYVEGRDG